MDCYTVALLRDWKRNAENVAGVSIGRALSVHISNPDSFIPRWNVPARNPFFTSRQAPLDSIRRAFATTRRVAISQPFAVTGLGGVGKTQTAIEYAHRYRDNYATLLWCVADSRAALASGFSNLATLLNLPQKNDPDLNVVGMAVRRWLESNSGWLLVLDNVEDSALVPEFAPIEHGRGFANHDSSTRNRRSS